MITDSLPYTFDDPATVQLLRGIAEIGEMAEVMLTLLPLRSAAEAEDPADIETRQANQQGQPSRLILPTELKVRESTAPPRQ
jgi:hypothetical protein